MTSKKFGLGWTADGERVVAEVELKAGDPELTVTFRDHHKGPMPIKLSICFDLRKGKQDVAFGQVPHAERVIVRRHANDLSEDEEKNLNLIWAEHHLNLMHAECAHMADQIWPSGQQLSDWMEAHPDESHSLQNYRLSTVVCPETGYRWGHSWLAEELPEDVLAFLAGLGVTP